MDFRVRHGIAVTNTATVESTVTSVSTDTGALRVYGGVGIAKDVYVGGIFSATGTITSGGDLHIAGAATISSPTESSSTDSGALQVVGGAGVGKNLYVGGEVNILSTTTATDTTSGALQVAGGVGIGEKLYVGDSVKIQSVTDSITTTTGALVVDGGIGVGKTIRVGGDLYVGGILYGTVLGSISTATNLFAGTAGQVPYQTGPGATSFFGPGTAGQILVSAGAAAPVYTNTGSIYVNAAEYANTLIGGATGSIPYQSGADTTVFLAGGTTGAFLKYNGSAPIWATTASFGGGTGSSTSAGGQSVYIASGGIGVNGNSYFANNVGLGGGLTIAGPTTFNNVVTFAGTATYVYSSNSVYTDSLIVLHKNTSGSWTFNDNLDIGMVGDYYDTTLSQAKSFFFGFKPSNRYLEFLVRGTESSPGIFTGDYGDLKLNTILLTSTATSTNSDTGALVVPGGVGIRGNVNLQDTGQLVVGVNLSPTLPDAPIHTAGDVDSYFQINSHNINSGPLASADLVLTADTGNDNQGYTDIGIANSNFAYPDFNVAGPLDSYAFANGGNWVMATSNPGKEFRFWTGGTTKPGTVGISTFTNTGTLTVSISSLNMTVYAKTSATSTSTGALQVRGGVGIGGDLWIGGTIYGTASITGEVTTATNIAGGTAGQGLYQQAPGITQFFGPGTAGQVLVSAGAAAPVYTNTGTLYVGTAVLVDDIKGGTPGQLVYQSAENTTEFLNTGTPGQLLMAEIGAPVFTNTSTIYVGTSNATNNVRGGTAGQVPYQVTTGTTSFFGPGTAGQLLMSSGTNAPMYVNTASIYVGRAALADLATQANDSYRATTATNLAGGAPGSVPYQSNTGTTAFVSIGTSSYILLSNGSIPYWGTQSGLGAGSADTIKVTNNVTSSTAHYLTFVSTSTGFANLNVAATTGITYIPSTNRLGINTNNPQYTLDVNSTTNAIIRANGTTTGGISLQNSSKQFTIAAVGTDLTFYDDSIGQTRARFDTNGNFGIGGVPTAKFEVAGTVKISGITTVTNVTASVSTTTGALQVYGGIGVGDSIYVKNRVGFVSTSNVSRVYQVYNATTDSLDTVFE